MLNINFMKTNGTGIHNEFMTAIDHEFYELNIVDTKDRISKTEKQVAHLDKEFEDGNISDDEYEKKLAGLESKLADLRKDLESFQKSSNETLDTYSKVITAMTIKNENGFGNDRDTVRTVLRVLATWNNQRLVKYAIIPAFQSPALYNALNTIHVTSKAWVDGQTVISQEVKDAYKKASAELERIVKTTFSLSFETDYTYKTRVKLTAEDKKLLNDCYIKGFKNVFDTNSIGVTSFTTREINTLVKVKTNKKGVTTYDYSGLASTIAMIVIKHYFN